MKPKMKFLVFGRGDVMIMKTLKLADLRKGWDKIFKVINTKKLEISEKAVLGEAAAVRGEKARNQIR